MASFYKFGRLPAQWPGRQRPAGWRAGRAPFKAKTWSQIEQKLERELRHLRAKDVQLALDIDFSMLRQDGGIYADAKPRTPKVLLSLTDGRSAVKRQFPADAFGFWQDNVWAIALTLEMLRAIDRYGVTQGDQQYVGFAALPARAGTGVMSAEDAASLLAKHSGLEKDAILAFPSVARAAARSARAKTHPDQNHGVDAGFTTVETAAQTLSMHLGAEL